MLRALQSLRDSSNEERPLNPTYDRAMTIIKNQAKGSTTIAMKILSWLVEARRTLSADELREAIAVENNRYELDEWDWTDNAIMLDVCAGLITIDEKSNVIRFVHYTVQEYLIGISLVGDGEKLDIATACATYLSFDVFSEPEQGLYGISDRVRRYPFLAYAGRYLPFHISLCQEDQTAELLLKLFENPGHISSYIQAYDYNGGASLGSDKPFPVQKALHIACWMGHKIVVQTILDNGVDIEAEDFKWERPLYIAAAGGHKEVVKLLLENGADVEAALYNGENPLHVAVLNGHREVVKLLLENGADISARGKDGFLALHIATSTRNEELIRLLLENGSSISAEADGGVTPLHLATKMGNKRLVELFLDLGADVNPVSTSHGETPLHGAVSIAGDAPTVKLLLSRGADIEARSHQGATPLHYAARAGKNEVIELLLDEGAQIDAKDQWGYTSLHHCAASGNRPDVFKLLLDRGADIFSTTPGVPEERHPQSILHSASRNHSESAVPIIQMLLKSGANESLRLEYEDAVLDEGLSKNHQAAHRFMAIMRDAHPFPKFQWQLEVERKQEELRVRRMRENEERYWERERQKKRDQEQDQCGASEESEEDKSEEEESEDESNSIRNDEGPEKGCRGWEEQEQRKGEAIAV
jgi:ankyrin repeat protein